VEIWQSYGEFKGGNFFETQCRITSQERYTSAISADCPLGPDYTRSWTSAVETMRR